MTDKESHIVEFKQNWRDDYLKTVSAFANSNGGVLFVGIKDKWNEENLKKLELNERQVKAVEFIKENGKITNKVYKELIKDISRITATRDLTNLVEKGILKMVGIGKRQVHYIMNDSK